MHLILCLCRKQAQDIRMSFCDKDRCAPPSRSVLCNRKSETIPNTQKGFIEKSINPFICLPYISTILVLFSIIISDKKNKNKEIAINLSPAKCFCILENTKLFL